MSEVLTGRIEAQPRWIGAMSRLFGKPATRNSDRVKDAAAPSVEEQLTDKLKGYLRQMDRALDWQAGFWFGPYMDRAGKLLNEPAVIAVSQYDLLRTEFDAKVKLAKYERLI